MLSKDVIRLLVKEQPALANKFIRCNKTLHKQVINDKFMMKDLFQHYQSQIKEEVSRQTKRFFNYSNVASGPVTNVCSQQVARKAGYRISFFSGFPTTGTISDLRVLMKNPQSKEAFARLRNLSQRNASLKRLYNGPNAINDNVNDICSGVHHVATMEYKKPFRFLSWAKLFLMCELVMLLILVTNRAKGSWKGKGMFSFLVIGIMSYVVTRYDLLA